MTPDLTWSDEESAAASEEGWDLFDVNGTGNFEIERIDDQDTFAGDEEALFFVRMKVTLGSALHGKALAIHETYAVSADGAKL